MVWAFSGDTDMHWCQTHLNGEQFARAGQIYWEVLTAHVEEFFQAHRAGIIQHWHEVHRFSRDLIEHSVDYQPLPADPNDVWFDTNELDKAEIGRQRVNGKLKAVRPITETEIRALRTSTI